MVIYVFSIGWENTRSFRDLLNILEDLRVMKKNCGVTLNVLTNNRFVIIHKTEERIRIDTQRLGKNMTKINTAHVTLDDF